jgi:hypothetical protein
MQFRLSASRLMKASEVRTLCKELRENIQVLDQQELLMKSTMNQHFCPDNEKAAS